MSGHSKWANIKHRKAQQDVKRGNEFTRIGRELMIAARMGGADPEANLRLKSAIQKARAANMPNETINRNIQKGIGTDSSEKYEELYYEGYGPGGVAILLRIATDNRNRTASEIRHIFTRNGGNLGESGCVSWMFDNKGLIVLNTKDASLDKDELILKAIELGAEDIKEEEDTIEIITEGKDLYEIKNALEEEGYPITKAEPTMIPKTLVKVEDENQIRQLLRLCDLLEEHDDVQQLYANFDISDEVLASIEA